MLFKLIKSKGWNDIYNIGNDCEVHIEGLVDTLMRVKGIYREVEWSDLRDGDHTRRRPDLTKLYKVIGKHKHKLLIDGLRETI
jgi:nucleoside-diphosphate-sugar epimerase